MASISLNDPLVFQSNQAIATQISTGITSLLASLQLLHGVSHWGKDQSGHHFANNIFRCNFLVVYLTEYSLTFVPGSLKDYMTSLLPVIVWHQTSDNWNDDNAVHWRIYASSSFTELTHWGRDKMAAVSQTTLSSSFSWMKMLEFRLRFHWTLFLRVQLPIIQHWFR